MGLTFRAFWCLYRVCLDQFVCSVRSFFSIKMSHKSNSLDSLNKTTPSSLPSSSSSTAPAPASISTAYRRKYRSILHGRTPGSSHKTGERCFLVDIRNPCSTRRKITSGYCFAVTASERDNLRREYLAEKAVQDSEAEVSEYEDADDEEQAAIDELTAQQENLRPKKSKSKSF